MQNGFIRTKVGVSLKKKFSLEKSEKKILKNPGFSLIKLQFVTSRGADLQGESRRVCNVANSAKCKVRAVRALPRSFSLLLANLELTRPDFQPTLLAATAALRKPCNFQKQPRSEVFSCFVIRTKERQCNSDIALFFEGFFTGCEIIDFRRMNSYCFRLQFFPDQSYNLSQKDNLGSKVQIQSSKRIDILAKYVTHSEKLSRLFLVCCALHCPIFLLCMSVLSVKNVRFDMAGSITSITVLQPQTFQRVAKLRQSSIKKSCKDCQEHKRGVSKNIFQTTERKCLVQTNLEIKS